MKSTTRQDFRTNVIPVEVVVVVRNWEVVRSAMAVVSWVPAEQTELGSCSDCVVCSVVTMVVVRTYRWHRLVS